MRQGLAERRNPTNRRLVLGFLIACLLLLVVGPQIKPVAAVLSPVYVPVESAVSSVTGDAGAFFGSLSKLPTLQKQNQDLQKEIAKLKIEVAQLPLYSRELRILEHQVRFRDLNLHLDIRTASLFGGSQSGLPTIIDVNAGSNDHVLVNNPVLDQNGYLIGKVLHVFPAYSEIGMLTDFGVNVPAMDANTGSLGLVDFHDGSVYLDAVQPGRKLRVGDFVVTSSIGGQYPLGLLVGQISSVHPATAQTLDSVPLRTAANLNGVSYVQIVRNFAPGVMAHYRTRRHKP